MNFEGVNPFRLSFRFHDCLLDYASFYKLTLKGGIFENCSLKSVEFSEANLSRANFTGSTLDDAIFQQTNLSQADFRSSVGYRINPISNTIRGAKFSKEEVMGLLVDFGIKIE